MLLALLILFVLLDCALAGFMATHALSTTDVATRRGYWLFSGVLTLNAAVCLFIYALYAHGTIF